MAVLKSARRLRDGGRWLHGGGRWLRGGGRWLRQGAPALLRHRAPPFVSWMLIEACNYTCAHCGCWRESPAALSEEQALRYAREMVQVGVLAVSLCGGEVTLRRDLGDILATLHRGGITTRITSNGRLVPRRIGELRGLSRLKLSLDGPPDLHDQVRGEGAFTAVLAALEAARGAGIPTELNCVLTRGLVDRLEETLDLVGRLGQRVTFNPLETRHEAAGPGVLAASPDPAALRLAVDRLLALRAAGDRRIANSPGTLRVMRGWPHLEPVDCSAGRWFCRVLVDGRVAACDRAYAPVPPPPPGQPPGFAAQVARLRRAGLCQEGCWRNNTIEVNRGVAGRIDALGVMRRWG